MKLLYYIFTFIVAIVLITGCKPSVRYFTSDPEYKGKYMLYSQKVKGNKHTSSSELEGLFKQKAQYKLLGFTPYLNIHYIGKSFYDTSYLQTKISRTEVKYQTKLSHADAGTKKYRKIEKKKNKKLKKLTKTLTEGNWMMSSFGEFPSILDSSTVTYTSQQIHAYLISKGYFRNTVKPDIDTLGRKSFVVYNISEGPVYSINEFAYDIQDSFLLRLVRDTKGSKLSLSDDYDETKISEERERVYKLIKNNGYYDFTRAYINFLVDSTNGPNQKIKVTTQIANPEVGIHQRYTINHVVFVPESGYSDSLVKAPDTIEFKKVHYCIYSKPYNYKILDGKIRLKCGSYYNQDSVQRTQQQLGSMDMFRFVNMNLIKKDSTHLDMMIYTSRLKKYQITQEYGLNMVQGILPGPFFNVNFRERNIFGNYEIFEVNVRYGIEGQASVLDSKTKLQTIEWGVNTSLTFPQLLVPTRLRFNAAKFNAKSRIILGYNSTNRPEYTRQGFRTQFSYLWQKNEFSFFNFSPIDINIINSTIKMQEFQDYLDTLYANGNNLKLSFNRSIVTNMNFSYTFSNSAINQNKPSYFFRPSFELGGIVPNIISRYITKDTGNTIGALQYYEYYKAQVDLRYYKPLNKKTTLASRINIGFSRPYGASGIKQNGSYILPYEKYFFAGGANSIRAWPYRRLGPGSYSNPDPNKQYTYEQPGNIIIETSFEYRRKLYRFFEGAYFVDAGNVWSIADQTKPGSEFKYFRSIPELAVGTGIGARLNFTFIIVRFDLAWKVWDPARPIDNRFVLFEREYRETPILNFSIGYPF